MWKLCELLHLTRTGVMTNDFKEQVMDYEATSSAYTITGTQPSIISARVSYVYNLYGPAMSVDTACSSSLVAIDLGSQALTAGKMLKVMPKI